MIASQYRFHGQNGIKFVYRKGQVIRTKHCAAKYLVNSRNETYRVSVVISKKTAKTAPMRNRIRRRLYEQVRVLAPLYLKNHDVVITVFDQDLAIAPAKEVEQLVKRLLKEIGSTTR